MFCKNCGAENKDGSKFCIRCGTVLVEQEPNPPKKNYWIFIVAGVVLAIVLAIVAAVLLHPVDNETSKKKSDKNKEKHKVEQELEELTNKEEESEDLPEATEVAVEAATEEAMEAEEVVEESYFNAAYQPLKTEIAQMNSGTFSLPRILIYENNRSVGYRDDSLTWDKTVFYALEGITPKSEYTSKNLCSMVKKEFMNDVTGNVIDYDIYINPINGVANKIVSIEYLDDGLEITEYYYDNNKKVSFVFCYYVDNYISTYATPDLPGERFLFCNDVLTTWRIVDGGNITNYVIGDNEIKRMKSSWASRTFKKYNELDGEKQAEFDDNERNMLNAAYNTYDFVINTAGFARIQGYVYDANSTPMSDATINLYADDKQSLLYSGQTEQNGCYELYVPSEEENYFMSICKDGFKNCDIYDVNVNDGQIGAYQDTAYLFDTQDVDVDVKLTLGDAFNKNSSGTGMKLLSNAQVSVREGMNNRYGDILFTQVADSNGYLCLNLKQGVYTIEVNAEGYETIYYNIIGNPNSDNIYELYTSPNLGDGEVAIVLTWGARPSDLDSHLFTTKGNTTSHIWYGRLMDENSNYLDVDDTTSYGPETVTIRDFNSNDYYKYCVVDYTNCSAGLYNSYDMSNSGATINVFSNDGMTGVYHVPTNMNGVIWEVFEIRNGQLLSIQRYYNDVSDKSWWNNDK